MLYYRVVLSIIAIILVSYIAVVVESRNINIDLKSDKWPKYSLSFVAEIAEAMAETGDDNLFLYIDNICNNDNNYSDKFDRFLVMTVGDDGYDEMLSELQLICYTIAESIIVTPTIWSLVDTSIGIGTYIPAVRLFQTISEPYGNPCNSEAFIVNYPNSTISCMNKDGVITQSSTTNIIDVADSYKESWDHYYHSDIHSITSKSILYGIIGTSSYCSIHNQLLSQAKLGEVSYSVRHAFPGIAPVTNEMRLQGYGVFLDIKNMEYKNIDDSTTAAAGAGNNDSSSITTSFSIDEEIAGINFAKVQSTYSDSNSDISKVLSILREQLINKETGIVTELKRWKLKDFGIQVLQTLNKYKPSHGADSSSSGSSTALVNRLADITQNFPIHAAMLSLVKVDTYYRDRMSYIWQTSSIMHVLSPNSIYINGFRVALDDTTFNVYDLLKDIKAEVMQLKKLSSIHVSNKITKQLQVLSKSIGGSSSSSTSSSGIESMLESIVRIDVSNGAQHIITFINNIEKDKMYKSWSKSLGKLQYPSWSMQSIAKNLYTMIANVDVMTVDGASLVMHMSLLWQQQYPIRLGIILTPTVTPSSSSSDTDASVAATAANNVCILFHHAKVKYSKASSLDFIFAMAETIVSTYNEGIQAGIINADNSHVPTISDAEIVEIFASSITEKNKKQTAAAVKKDALAVLNDSNKQYHDILKATNEYMYERGLEVNSYSVNGMVQPSPELSQNFMQILAREQYLMGQLYGAGVIDDSTASIFTTLLQHSHAYIRYHSILDEKSVTYIDTFASSFDILSSLLHFHQSSGGRSNNRYSNSTIIVAPMHSNGYASIASAFRWVKSSGTVSQRVAVAFQPLLEVGEDVCDSGSSTDTKTCSSSSTEDMMLLISYVLEKETSIDKLISLFDYLSSSASTTSSDSVVGVDSVYTFMGMNKIDVQSDKAFANKVAMLNRLTDVFFTADTTTTSSSSSSSTGSTGTSSGDSSVTIVYNSRVIKVSKPMHELDYALLAGIEYKRLNNRLDDMIDATDDLSSTVDDAMYLHLNSFCGKYSTTSGSRIDVAEVFNINQVNMDDFKFDIYPYTSTATTSDGTSSDGDIEIYYIIDPLSVAGQRVPAILKLIQEQLHIHQTLLIIPKHDYTEFPLQNFYRYILSSHDQQHARAEFRALPRQHTLTVRVDSPELWNIQATVAYQDIDNLRCDVEVCGDKASNVKDTTDISYTLRNILVTGQCYQTSHNSAYAMQPPNGLQLHLSPMNSDIYQMPSDTLVMQNLGYYQLKAAPGVWKLSLASGRATDLYTIVKASPRGGLQVVVNSYSDQANKLHVAKRRGMEDQTLLEDIDTTKGSDSSSRSGQKNIWNGITSLFGTTTAVAAPPADANETIHVFSLATGHMYERLLRIMMLSVTKHTCNPVKFWLLENYLSPTFKQVAAVMAAEYGFEVGYVTYKWPDWLRQQTNKQRIIWGYKILFLDVLFPLDVKKVIYVDADQVVRADLKELWELDLHGKPYAYTPFCDSREETLGFQFWRHGYWADHLRGRPYHISALYVVDLQRFRRMAVGDQLRALYDQLARDPNSLANLDQDLPNYAQHVVPIHSLPQEWLWCETWCSDKSKEKAKTIDLCNNPLHKEPKLDMARRVISGHLFNESWVQLDEEIKALEARNHVLVSTTSLV